MSTLATLYPLQLGENNPYLRKSSTHITDIDDDVQAFADALKTLLWEYEGVGLAAPQVGKNIRMIATTQWKSKRSGKDKLIGETIMINPEIVSASDEMIQSEEACLSLPDTPIGVVDRHKIIEVAYMDEKGNTQQKKYKDFNACIIQHEIDHLDGVLYIDKLSSKK